MPPFNDLKSRRNQELGFRKSHAFVIGINEYRGLDANLKTAVGDSQEIAMRLKVLQGFDHVLLMNNVSQIQIATLLDWIKDPERSRALSIPEETFTFGSSSYQSQVHWLKMAGEVTDTNGLGRMELVIDEGQTDELRQTIFLAPDHQLDIKAEDSIVFYYAGHGFPGEIKDGPAGYLAATDATNKLLDNDSLLPMDDVYKALSTLNCKHTLLILDCCFAGKFRFSSLSRGRPKPFLMPMYQRRYERYKTSNAWQVLVSAGPDQTANDSAKWANIRNNSPFAATLIEALEGKADIPMAGNRGRAQGDGIITATELFLYVWDRVEKLTGEVKPQHPGLFPMAQHREGEFIFINPKIDSERFKFAEDPDKNPYKGLLPYEEKDAEVFFGREQVITELVERLTDKMTPILFITGPSGSGKSSLVKAGLFPALKEFEALLVVRPGELLGAAIENPFPGQTRFEELKSALNSNKKFLLLIDQYEELFSLPEKDLLQERVLDLFEEVIKHQQKAIFTLRSDFEWQLKSSPLGEYWDKKRIYRVPPMDLDELRQALTGPAWWAMYDFKDHAETTEEDTGETLINEILEEIANAPGALPLLSFTMQAFYEIARDRQQRLILEDYLMVLKGVEGALSVKADEVYLSLSREEQEIMQKVLIRMINVYDGSFTKRRVFYSEFDESLDIWGNPVLYELDFPAQNELIKAVIDKLEAAHLVVQGRDEEGRSYVEPAHDSLITHWDRCRQWLDEFGKENVILQRQLWQAVLDSKQHEEQVVNNENQMNVRADIPENLERQKSSLSEFSQFWDNNPKLLQVVNLVMEAGMHLLLQNEGPEAEAIRQISQELSEPDRKNFQTILNDWVILKRITNLNTFILTGASERLLDLLLTDGQHWLNREEVAFIQQSWVKRTQDMIGLKRERDDAIEAKEQAEAKTREVLANKFAFDAQLNPDRTTAFRLVEFATAIDPNNPKALEQLICCQSLHKTPTHFSLTSHSDAVWSVAFSPDGSKILTASREIILWDAHTGSKIINLPGQERACFSTDGKQAAFATREAGIILWDLENNQELYRFDAHKSSIIALEFSPNGEARLLSASRDKTIKVWDLVKRSLFVELKGSLYQDDIKSASYSPDGKLIVSVAQKERSGSILLWNALSGKIISDRNAVMAHDGAAKFAADGSVFSVSANNQLHQWILEENKVEQLISNSADGYFRELAVSPDASMVAIACSKVVKVYDLKSRKQLHQLAAHSDRCNGVTFSADGQRLASYSDDRTVRVWDLSRPDAHFILPQATDQGEPFFIKSLFSPDAKYILTISRDKFVRIWSVEQQQEVQAFLPNEKLRYAAFSPDGQRIVGATENGDVYIRDVNNSEHPPLPAFKHGKGATFARFIRKNQHILCAYENGDLKIWDTTTGMEVTSLIGHEQKINYVDVSPDGNHILSASNDQTVRIWNLSQSDTGIIRPSSTIRPDIQDTLAVVFSRDGSKFVVTGSARIKVYDFHTLQEIHSFNPGDDRPVLSAGFSPNGSKVVSMSDLGKVIVWDLLTNRLFFTIAGFDQLPRWIDLHPQQWQILITHDGYAQLQSIDSAQIISSFTQQRRLSTLTAKEMNTYEFELGLPYAAPGWWTSE